MATEVATLTAKLEADIRDFERGMDRAERSMNDLERSSKDAARGVDSSMDKAGRSMDGVGTKSGGLTGKLGGLARGFGGVAAIAGIGFGLHEAVQFIGSTIGAASDLEESINAVEVVFEDAAPTILEFGETAATTVGLSKAAYNELATTTGALLLQFGLDHQAAAEEVNQLSVRAADMASVFNTSVPEAMEAIGSALRGETEPIRRFGVTLNDAAIRAKAVELGLAATTAQVTQQHKGIAALKLIYEQTNAVAGDFANTSDSLANQQRQLAAEWENAQAEIGQALLPAMVQLVEIARDAIPVLVALANAAVGVAGEFAKAVRPAIEFAEALGLLGDASEETAAGFDKNFGDISSSVVAWLTGPVDMLTTLARGSEVDFGEDIAEWLDRIGESGREASAYLQSFAVSNHEARVSMSDSANEQKAFTLRMEAATAAAAEMGEEIPKDYGAIREAAIEWAKAQGTAVEQIERANRDAERSMIEMTRTTIEELGDGVDAWNGAAEEITLTAEEMMQNVVESAQQMEQWRTDLNTLANAGMDELVAVLIEGGVESAGVAAEMAGNMNMALGENLFLEQVAAGKLGEMVAYMESTGASRAEAAAFVVANAAVAAAESVPGAELQDVLTDKAAAAMAGAAAARAAAAAAAAVPMPVKTITVNWRLPPVPEWKFGQFGGPLTKGDPYIVGEAGPELFIPSDSGTLIPNHSLGGLGGNTAGLGGNTAGIGSAGGTAVTVNVAGSVQTERDLAKSIADTLAGLNKSGFGGF